jgi:ribonuclease HI
MEFLIYTDGACQGNQFDSNKGGWAFILLEKSNPNPIKIIADCEKNTTNNRMELMGCIKGLDFTFNYCTQNKIQLDNLTIFSDSAYIVNCFKDKWYISWKKNGWKNTQHETVKNKELWQQLIPYFCNPKIEFVHVKGHQGNKFNELVDQHATNAINNCSKLKFEKIKI